jgi:hypothetical protein
VSATFGKFAGSWGLDLKQKNNQIKIEIDLASLVNRAFITIPKQIRITP